MFDGFYSFNKVNIEKPIKDKYLVCTHNYTFKVEGTHYIAKVEQYTGKIFIIKFFRKQDRKMKNRYHILTGEFRCAKIVSTCIRILKSILDKIPDASFGFLGSNTVTKKFEELKNETKRFKIYKRAMENLVGDTIFEHSMDLVNSTYLMVNKNNRNIDLFINDARVMFDEIFPDLIY